MIVAIPLMLAGLCGCGGGVDTIQTRSLTLEVEPKANGDNALAVDIVLVYDDKITGQIAGLSAMDWFAKRNEMVQSLTTSIEVRRFEVIPGQAGPRIDFSGRTRDAVAVFLFAGYTTPGAHRSRLDAFDTVVVRLGDKDFAVAAGDKDFAAAPGT